MSEKVARNIFSLIFAKILAGILVFIGYASLFRYLDPFRTGQYQFVLSYVLLFSVIIDFGIEQLVIKRISEQKSEAKKYLGHFFAVEFLLAVVVYGILVLIIALGGHEAIVRNAIIVAGFGMFLNALTIPHTAVISGFEDMHKLAIVNFFDSVINVAVMFTVILLHRSIVLLATVQAVMGVMHFIVYSIAIKKYVPKPELFKFLSRIDFTLVKEMLIAALPFGMLVGFSIVYNKIDVILLSALRGYTETGLYTAAYKFFDLIAFVPAVVSSALYPFFSSKLKQDGAMPAVRDALKNYTRYMIALALPLAFGGVVLAPKLILLVAGPSFYSGFPALQILVFGSAVLFIYAAVNSIMINKLTRLAAWITFANIFINTAGNLLLIPHYGFKAAAFMTVFSEIAQAGLYFYFVRTRIVSFPFFRYFIKPLLAAALMATFLFPFRFHPIYVTLPFGAVIYSVLIVLSGFFEREDLDRIKRLLSRSQISVNEEVLQ